ncbi:hypothetical protein Cst_c04880 [Thermoclostridium stercorarium subsp. stercorarium DSM 8532]|uniref:Uncharacterized protein n=1 Tax=Thermoclostridium stercorarium (strain ATCC 35414 / DSM 8532 / NCIMB 11754) TaxID=1121335 RepID=L7VHJ3_THES1|nr:hypothetical protein Cst_c04880 [Thermoclostridium stercorarium subsp. stercorarium DSM 8532]
MDFNDNVFFINIPQLIKNKQFFNPGVTEKDSCFLHGRKKWGKL